MLELHGPGDLARELNATSKAGHWSELARRLSNDIVSLFAAVGTHKDIARRIEERFGGLSDAINLRPDASFDEGDVSPDVIQEIKRIPRVFAGYKTAW